MAQVRKGDRVKIQYTGKLKDGTVFETTVGGEPLSFTVGKGKLIKGFDNALLGMTPGQTKTVTVSPAQGYGPHDPSLAVTVDRSDLPEGITPAVGEVLTIKGADGSPVEVNVTRVEGDRVTLDRNHPLAGKNLTFEIKLIGIG
jgi:peptidylprolyl isomerase